ncbi:restriction endonuclease subunit S [Myxococcota bacterium]|nr:restriction endonuclease subunit S [Myxococcota bacterium]
MTTASRYRCATLPEIVGDQGLLTDGDWVESKDQDSQGTIRLTQLADVGDGTFRDRSDRWLNDEQAARLGVTYLSPGDVLVARMPDPLGRACVFPGLTTRAVTVVDVCVVRAPKHNPKWLMYMLNAPQTREQIASLEAGSTRKRISKKNLSTIPIPVPERSEQDRVAGAVDRSFSQIESAERYLDLVQAKLKRARASVLKAAVEGRLVPTEAELARAEGRTYEPASELLIRILAERRAKWEASRAKGKYKPPVGLDGEVPVLPEGWTWATADQLSWASGYGTSVKCDSEAAGSPVLRIPNVQRGVIDLGDLKYATKQEELRDDGALYPGDLIFVRTNGSLRLIGRGAAVLDHFSASTHFASYLIRLRLCGTQEFWRWVALVWNGPIVRRRIESDAASSAGQFNVSLTTATRYALPLPPFPEQQRIVAEVDRRLSVLDKIEATVEANLARCAKLRQSILKRAFEGRLVAPAPALPASVDASKATKKTASQLALFDEEQRA